MDLLGDAMNIGVEGGKEEYRIARYLLLICMICQMAHTKRVKLVR